MQHALGCCYNSLSAGALRPLAEHLHILPQPQSGLRDILQLLLVLPLLALCGFNRGGQLLSHLQLLGVALGKGANHGLPLPIEINHQHTNGTKGEAQGDQNGNHEDIRHEHSTRIAQKNHAGH